MPERVERRMRYAGVANPALPFHRVDRADKFIFVQCLDGGNLVAAQNLQDRGGVFAMIDVQMGDIEGPVIGDQAV